MLWAASDTVELALRSSADSGGGGTGSARGNSDISGGAACAPEGQTDSYFLSCYA